MMASYAAISPPAESLRSAAQLRGNPAKKSIVSLVDFIPGAATTG
jgi:hypothetical protein